MLTYVATPNAPRPFSNYSQGVEVGPGMRVLYVSGQVGATPEGKIADSERLQHELAWTNVLTILKAQAMSAADLVECHVYLTNRDSVALYREIRDRMLKGARPAATLLVVAGLASPEILIEISAVAAASPRD